MFPHYRGARALQQERYLIRPTRKHLPTHAERKPIVVQDVIPDGLERTPLLDRLRSKRFFRTEKRGFADIAAIPQDPIQGSS